MTIQPSQDLSDLSVNELYSVYLAIARCDHLWRRKSLYGGNEPPKGQCDLRPLGREQFVQRFEKAKTFVGGELMLRQRLAKQVAAYSIDLKEVLQSSRLAS